MLIFLDIDGVMVPAKGWKVPELLNDGFPAFSSKATHALKSLISIDTTLILTTSHKSNYSLNEWVAIFKKRGIEIEKIKCLENNSTTNLNRKEEILNWFNSNAITEDYIIIDDDTSLNALPKYLKDHLLLTSPLIGLTDEHLDTIKNIISNNATGKNVLKLIEELGKPSIPEGVDFKENYYKERSKKYGF
jgi:hypothetical protein